MWNIWVQVPASNWRGWDLGTSLFRSQVWAQIPLIWGMALYDVFHFSWENLDLAKERVYRYKTWILWGNSDLGHASATRRTSDFSTCRGVPWVIPSGLGPWSPGTAGGPTLWANRRWILYPMKWISTADLLQLVTSVYSSISLWITSRGSTLPFMLLSISY